MGGCASFPSPGGNAPVLVFALFLDEPRPSITSTKSRLGLGSSVLRTIQTGCIVVPTRDTSWETGLCVVAKIPRVYSVAENSAPLWLERAAHPLNLLSTGQGDMLEKPPPQRENQLRHVHQVEELGLSTQHLLLELAARHNNRSSF